MRQPARQMWKLLKEQPQCWVLGGYGCWDMDYNYVPALADPDKALTQRPAAAHYITTEAWTTKPVAVFTRNPNREGVFDKFVLNWFERLLIGWRIRRLLDWQDRRDNELKLERLRSWRESIKASSPPHGDQ